MATPTAPPAAPAPPLRATSLKRPHWVLLGFEKHLRTPAPQSHRVLGAPVVTYVGGAGELGVLQRACPHRGADLGRGRVERDCLVCPYHGARVSAAGWPHRSYDHAVLQGHVWMDYAKDLCTQHHMPPYFPELSSKEYSVLRFTRTVPASPLALVEHMVGALGYADLPESVAYVSGSPHGSATYTLATPYGEATLESQFHVPYTCCVRLRFGDEVAVAAVGSVLPVSPAESKMHVAIARQVARRPWSVWAVRLIRLATQLMLLQHANVRGVDPRDWRANQLGTRDALVAGYRESLRRLFPELVDYLTSHAQ